jgi:signal peptidase I
MTFKLLKVSGGSMLPQYKDGDFVLVSRIPVLLGWLAPGNVIVFESKDFGAMIKIVDSLSSDGKEMTVKGAHPLSVDSHTIGTVRKEDVTGKVIWHFRKAKRSREKQALKGAE